MTVATMQINEELNGIELYFDNKPEQKVLENLKANKFRWSNYKKCWYSKQSDNTFKLAEQLINNTNNNEAITEPTKTHSTPKKENVLSLWDATQWTDIEVDQTIKDKDCKEIAKEIRTHIRKQFPQCKFSVTVPYYGRISFDIKSSPYEKDSQYLGAIREYCKNLLNTYKHCYSPSDPYTDYAGVYNFTGWAEISWQYEQTGITEEIKKDMADFDKNQAASEKLEQEKKEKEFQERQQKRELEAIASKKYQEEEKKQIEIIYNSVEVKSLENNDQYFIIGSEFANLNKRSTLDQYREEVKIDDYILQDIKITKEIHFNSEEALTNFSNMLLNDFDFLSNTGGSFTDDLRINSMADFDNMDDEEQNTVKWNLEGVAIYSNNKLQFTVDTQGHKYARYVGLTDNSKIEKTLTTEPAINEQELTELKQQADQLEDISTTIITDLNIVNTWQKDNWTEYKEAFKSELKLSSIKLNKRIIQQLEIEELKSSMYKLLIEVDGIQDQFEHADIQKGEKITLFYISDFGSIITSRITFDSATPSKYAQYDNAIKLVYKPDNKRKFYSQHFYSTLLVYKGWYNLPKTVLNTIEERPTMTITSSKYLSCDKRQYDEILTHMERQEGAKPIINTYKPTF